MGYLETVIAHHSAFWRLGIPTDIVDMESDLTGYKLIAAPMAYLLRAGFAQKLKQFCEQGGILLGTYWSGVVDENDLCFLGGTPGEGLTELFGLRREEIDGLYDGQFNRLLPTAGSLPQPAYQLRELCELVRCSTAQTLAQYGDDFYKGHPALTVNSFGRGKAYYLAARGEQQLLDDLTARLVREAGLTPALDACLPKGVTATVRFRGSQPFIFVQNFNAESCSLTLNQPYLDAESGQRLSALQLEKFAVRILTAGCAG